MSAEPTPAEAMRGQPLAMRVMSRIAELEASLAALANDEPLRRGMFEQELAIANGFLTGDTEHPSDVVAHDMSSWLERNRYLA